MTNTQFSSHLLSFLLLLTLFKASRGGKIAVYWGQGNQESEGTLTETCQSKLYDHVNIAFLSKFGGGPPELNLAGHCDPAAGTCTRVSSGIHTCQSLGIKVMLSLGGGTSGYSLSSEGEATQLAGYLWKNFLGGMTGPGPLGDARLDGIDFDIELGDTRFYDTLANALASHGNVILTAAPQCPFPDGHLQAALNTGKFQRIWVQFYNNPVCGYKVGNTGDILNAWKQWQSAPVDHIYMGLPAGYAAANNGYIPKDNFINNILPTIKGSPKYGGVMLWNRQFDIKSGYSQAIKAKEKLNIKLALMPKKNDVRSLKKGDVTMGMDIKIRGLHGVF